MYLTRFEINKVRRAARDLLASPQRMHAAVLAAFPTACRNPSDQGRVLWRIDQRGHQTLLYVTSPYPPDLTHLVETAGWPATQACWDSRPYAPLLQRLTAGERWAFRLTANPAFSKPKSGESARSQRFGHVTVAQQTGWLLDRAETYGFTVPEGQHKEPDVAVHDRKTVRFARRNHTVTLSTATFEGQLEVVDPAPLRHALTHGIGPAKSYGCGLLTLAALR